MDLQWKRYISIWTYKKTFLKEGEGRAQRYLAIYIHVVIKFIHVPVFFSSRSNLDSNN